MAEIRWTQEAVRWLENIHSFIANDNAQIASKIVSEIYQKTQLLKDFPSAGYLYRKVEEGEIRILLYGHYRIAYLVKEELVEILGVFHGAMNIEEYLQ